MKHIFLIIITLFSLSVFAQSGTPRTGVGVFHDNTFRAMTLKYLPVVDTSSVDTVKLSLNAYKTLVSVPSLINTVTFTFPSISSCYLGDEVTIIAVGSGALSFSGANVAPSLSLGATVNISTRGIITFIFDGTTWLEESRNAQ